MKRIPSLDGFRAISIILVLFSHSRMAVGFPHQYNEIAQKGAIGVTVFFVISGLLITTLLLQEENQTDHINIKEFYIRRAFRILPVALLYVLFISVWRNIEDIKLKNGDIIHGLTFTINFTKHFGSWFIGHFWTLSVEEQFYIIWPAIFLFSKKHLKTILCVFIVYSCVARVIGYKFPDYSIAILAPYFSFSDSIMIGAFGAIILFENPDIIKMKIFDNYFLQFIAAIIIAFFVYCSGYGRFGLIALPFGNTLTSLSILFLILSYITPKNKPIYKILNNKVMIHIGVLSYSIYIWQQFFFTSGEKVFVWRIFPLNLVVIYFVALASYYLWEKPFLKLRIRVLKPIK